VPTPIPLTLAGSDPTGGAGLEADLKTFLLFGYSGAAVATALTTQDTSGVTAVAAEPAERFVERTRLILGDLPIAGLKVGLLPSVEIIEAIGEIMRGFDGPCVVDPVLAPTAGAPFLDEDGRMALIEHVLPHTTVLTPNIPEAELLLGLDDAAVVSDPHETARRLLDLGPDSIVLKGGHATSSDGGKVTDYLAVSGSVHEMEAPRLPGPPVHGTGCALSSAILCTVLDGVRIADAVVKAKEWLHDQIATATSEGRGARRLPFRR